MTCTRTNFIIKNGIVITDVISCLKKEFVTSFQIKTTSKSFETTPITKEVIVENINTSAQYGNFFMYHT